MSEGIRKKNERGSSHTDSIQEMRPIFDRGQDLHEKVLTYFALIPHRFLSVHLKTTYFVRLLAKHSRVGERNGQVQHMDADRRRARLPRDSPLSRPSSGICPY
jgi:hypothetical protein